MRLYCVSTRFYWVLEVEMTVKQWKLTMNLIMLTGVLFVLAGVGLYLFTNLANQGVAGMQKIALTIGAGLVLLIPSKLFLTLLLMGMGDDAEHSKPGK